MDIVTKTYSVRHNPVAASVTIRGVLRLNGIAEYAPILDVLERAVAAHPERIVLDLRELNFLNSSGITMLSKFAIGLRPNQMARIQVLGSRNIAWQGKSLKNLQRLLPHLDLQLRGDMNITTDDYSVWYDSITATAFCEGALRLNGTSEYAPLLELLVHAAADAPEKFTLNVQKLKYLNSSGINMLSKFVIFMRQQDGCSFRILGSTEIPWQGKSLKNLQRLMPALELVLA
ncbi:MAG: hypothetical protein AAFY57_03600 [Cyanobacteria bacterium J06642_2]